MMDIDNSGIKKQSRKINYRLIFLFFLVLFVAFLSAKYFFYEKNYRLVKKSSDQKFGNIQNQIYNTSDLENLTQSNKGPSSGISDEEISKNIYPNLAKQQLQIESLQEKYNYLKAEIERIKNQDKLSKIIISFIEVRDCINRSGSCENELQKLELLVKFNPNLTTKILALKVALQNKPKSSKQIKAEFNDLTLDMIAAKRTGTSQNFLDKIIYYISKVIVIRRVDGVVGKESQNIDFVIVEVEKLIDQNKYQQASDLLSEQDEIYKPTMNEFISDLQNANQLNRLVDEIFSYLKSMQDL